MTAESVSEPKLDQEKLSSLNKREKKRLKNNLIDLSDLRVNT